MKGMSLERTLKNMRFEVAIMEGMSLVRHEIAKMDRFLEENVVQMLQQQIIYLRNHGTSMHPFMKKTLTIKYVYYA